MKPRLGIIGGGIYGSNMLQTYSFAHRMGQIELVTLAEIKPDVLEKQTQKYGIRGYLDYKEMLKQEKLDAVAIVTPDYLHREIALEAASHGVHLLVQKPLDVTTEGAREIVRAAKENNLLLYVDFHKRVDPAHVELKNAIANGKIGQVEYGYVWMENPIVVPTVYFRTWAQYSSPAWFIGIHWFDLIYWLLESKPVKVYATARKEKLVSLGIDTYDSVQAKIEFENGACFTVDSSWILPNAFPSPVNQGIRVVGTDGLWEVDSQDRGVFYLNGADPGITVPNFYGNLEKENPLLGSTMHGYVNESMLYFTQLVKLIKEGTDLNELKGLYPSGEDGIVSTQICEAAHLSAQSGKIIEIG